MPFNLLTSPKIEDAHDVRDMKFCLGIKDGDAYRIALHTGSAELGLKLLEGLKGDRVTLELSGLVSRFAIVIYQSEEDKRVS